MNGMGQRIKEKRIENHMSMEELGKKLGVQRQTVSKWEHNEICTLKRSVVAKLASVLHCSPVWLLGYQDVDEVTLTYEAPQKESLKLLVDKEPIIGQTSKIAELYKVILAIEPQYLDIAINLLKPLVKKENNT